MSVNGCTFLKLLKAQGMEKVLFYFFAFFFSFFLSRPFENGCTSPEILISD